MGSTSDRTDALRTSATHDGESGPGKESRLSRYRTMSWPSPCCGPHHQGPMISVRQLDDLLIRVLTLSATVLSLSGNAFAQESPLQVPANATARQYGSGWDCDQGYREREGTCAVVGLPANAFPTNYSFGPGWECSHGYRSTEDSCAAIAVPSNGYLDDSGDSWKCNRGYRAVDDRCVVIHVPESGYLTDSSVGTGWACNRGYRAVDDVCVAIEVPEHGYLWDVSYGSGWRCERGYRAFEEACIAVEVPENAHLNSAGDNWDCNRPYRRQAGECADAG